MHEEPDGRNFAVVHASGRAYRLRAAESGLGEDSLGEGSSSSPKPVRRVEGHLPGVAAHRESVEAHLLGKRTPSPSRSPRGERSVSPLMVLRKVYAHPEHCEPARGALAR